jgi:hypothetical protein
MKGKRLTSFILIAMVLGVLVGYLMNQFGTGTGITYSPNKDYTGTDTITLNISGEKIDQRIFVVKDSSIYKRLKIVLDHQPGWWLQTLQKNILLQF